MSPRPSALEEWFGGAFPLFKLEQQFISETPTAVYHKVNELMKSGWIMVPGTLLHYEHDGVPYLVVTMQRLLHANEETPR